MVGQRGQGQSDGPLRWVAEDAQERVFSQWTGCPPAVSVIGEPVVRRFVVDVVLVEQRDQHVHVEQRGLAHTSSRKRLTSAIVMIGAP